jgi:hypothetical protein
MVKRRGSPWLLRVIAAGGAVTLALGCGDPVHDDAVRALGPEDPAVPPGPLHRPGQPCLACHGAEGPASLRLTLGGTVYDTNAGTTPAVNAYVQTEDIGGNYWTVQTNAAGNFFVEAAHFEPAYPIRMTVVSSDMSVSQQMSTYSARDGSCADCHAAPAGPRSPGPVYLNLVLGDGGATP